MTKLDLGFYGRMLFLTPTELKLGMWLGASVAFAFNRLTQGPVTPPMITMYQCGELNPRHTDSQP